MICPRCHNIVCDCLLEDPGYLARALGKQLRLLGSEAQGLSTPRSGVATDDGAEEDNGDGHEDGWDQTPEEICRKIIGAIGWTEGELVLEPFCGDGNFYNNLPNCVRKDWCEKRRGRDFFKYGGSRPDTIITNPPFRDETGGDNLVVPCLERCLQVARQRVVYFVNHKVFNALTPGRLREYGKWGWRITHLSIWDVRKWFGRYYLIVFEKNKPGVIGYFQLNSQGGNAALEMPPDGELELDNRPGIETGSYLITGCVDHDGPDACGAYAKPEDHQELSLGDRAVILRSGKQCPEHGIVYTPPHVAQFLFDLLSPLHPEIVLDVASGNGALNLPWRDMAKSIEYEIGFGQDFFQCPDFIDTDLVVCNPPFNDGQEKKFLRRIIQVVPETTPIVLFATHRVRLGSYASSADWRWCRDEWPPITSIVSLPRGVFPGVNETVEILLFRTPHLQSHYFLPDVGSR